MEESIQSAADTALQVLTTYGLNVVAAIAILIIGFIVAGWAKRATLKALGRVERFDQTLCGFFASMVRYGVIIVTVLAVLDRFGIETTSLIAVLGAAGLAIGLALQGTLSDLAAGVMLLIFRPLKVGEYIEGGGEAGTVVALTLFTTELKTPDNVMILLPNSQLWGTAIKNYSRHDTRRVDFVFGIAYEDEIGKAMAAIRDQIGKDARIHADPEPLIVVGELADSSVNLIVRVWCGADDYWNIKFDLTRAVKERLDAERISIPYPQRVVHRVSG